MFAPSGLRLHPQRDPHPRWGTKAQPSALRPQNSKSPVQQLVYESMIKKESVLTKSYQEAIQRVLDSNYAFIGESISQDLAVAQHCNLVRSPEVLGPRGFGIATPKGKTAKAGESPLPPSDTP